MACVVVGTQQCDRQVAAAGREQPILRVDQYQPGIIKLK